jgi:hypothetical protein
LGRCRALPLLRHRRCLLVLDNAETLFEPGQPEGLYREGMAGGGRLLETVGHTSHQSCVLLTSREAPPEVALPNGAVRTFELGGLPVGDAQVLLAPKQLEGTSLHRRCPALSRETSGSTVSFTAGISPDDHHDH